MKSRDPREQPVNDAALMVMVQANYDPHFSGVADRCRMETLLFLARYDALRAYELKQWANQIRTITAEPRGLNEAAAPIPMILFCPNCGVQHIDAEEPHKPECLARLSFSTDAPCTCERWTNPSHLSHLCHYCAHVWRPADVATTGVPEITTKGGRDTPSPIRFVINKTARFRPEWRHKARGTQYVELGRGELQLSTQPATFTEGARMVAYQGEDNRVWFRLESEFDDGRFERILK